jgi:hypothetical protein
MENNMAEVKMTDELRAKLAGALPMRNGASIDYVPEMYDSLEIDKATREYISPIVKLRQWTNKEVMAVREQQQRENVATTKKAKAIDRRRILLELCSGAILDIENFRDSELELVEFNKDNIILLPEAAIMNIFDKLSDISGLTQATYTQVEQAIKAKAIAKKMVDKEDSLSKKPKAKKK